jgi:hypothetical protein
MFVFVVVLRLKRLLLVCPLCLYGKAVIRSCPCHPSSFLAFPLPEAQQRSIEAYRSMCRPRSAARLPHTRRSSNVGNVGESSARLLPPLVDMQNFDVNKCQHFLIPRAAPTLNFSRYNSLRPAQNSVKAVRTCPKRAICTSFQARQRTHVIISTALVNLRSRARSSIVPELETKPLSCYTTPNLQPGSALVSPRLRVPHLEDNRRDGYGRP